jgi:glycogen operon protein
MRERIKRNLFATLVFSQGVRMITGGDEMGRTQHGNNNAYCQDNETSWVRWDLTPQDRELLEFARECLRIFHSNPVLRRRSFFTGKPIAGEDVKDIAWIRPDGKEMTDEDWADSGNHVLGMMIPGEATDEVNERGRPIFGDTLLCLLNGGARSRYFELPRLDQPGIWYEVLNTGRPGARPVKKNALNLVAHSLILLRYGEQT